MSEERVLCYDHKVDPDEVPTYWLKDHCPNCLRSALARQASELEAVKKELEPYKKRYELDRIHYMKPYVDRAEKAEAENAALKERIEMAEFLVRGGDRDAALDVLQGKTRGVKS